jgi:hypothetical protein
MSNNISNKNFLNAYVYYIDNFLDKKFIDDFSEKVLRDSWTTHNSSGVDKNFFWFLPITAEKYSKELNFLSQHFPENDILRVYVNGQSGLQHGNFHSDDGEETFLIGLTRDWSTESGGATEFHERGDHTTFSVYPLYNRLVRFPAQLKHRALPNIDLETFRMTLALKTVKKNNKTYNEKFDFVS